MCNTINAIVAVLIVAAPLQARAAVALLTRCDDDGPGQLVGVLARELAEHGVMLRGVETTPRPCAPRLLSALTRRFGQARAAFEEMRVDEAATAFADLRRAIDETTVDLGQLPLMTLTYLGWIGLERRDARAANEAFEAAVRRDPSWSPDTTTFPPNVVAAHKEQRARLAQELAAARPPRVAVRPPSRPGDRLRQALEQGGAALVSELAVLDLDGVVLVENDNEASASETLVGTVAGIQRGPVVEKADPSAAVPGLLALLAERPPALHATSPRESFLRPRTLAIAGGALAVVTAVVVFIAVRAGGSDTVHVEVQPPVR